MLTGFLGVGGGFLVVPALVALTGMPMRRAVGTSLVVIALNSAAGLVSHVGRGSVPLGPTVSLTALAAAGALAGVMLSGRLKVEHLRRGFAGLVLGVGLVVVGRVLFG
jgi:uncharacterized membrane protein YfcA